MSTAHLSTRTVEIPLSREVLMKATWTIVLQSELDGSYTIGLRWNDKDYMTHATTLSGDELRALLDELRVL